jgi:hypothetical protein
MTKKEWLRLWLGGMLLVVPGLLHSCRESKPPSIEICILSPQGGADCVERDGSQTFKTPSQIENYWATNQEDMKAFSSWCYDTYRQVIEVEMKKIKEKTQNHYELSHP